MLGNFTNISERLLLISNRKACWWRKLYARSVLAVMSRSKSSCTLFANDSQKSVRNTYLTIGMNATQRPNRPTPSADCSASSWAAPHNTSPFMPVPTRSLAGTARSCRYLRRKLKCDNSAFHSLCNELIQKIAERNYQLEVLSTQVPLHLSSSRTYPRHAWLSASDPRQS